jgi:hypothetical protein
MGITSAVIVSYRCRPIGGKFVIRRTSNELRNCRKPAHGIVDEDLWRAQFAIRAAGSKLRFKMGRAAS